MATEPCPICQKPVEVGSVSLPFCSKRCRLVDLGRWFGEAYRVPVKKTDEDGDEEQETDET